ncbi:gliding motility-associated C-terminal domain-containing protein [Cesiribacter sp. SM1]|uniref:T9SS type B sorting domain-containing protein n=1 Tax=Cesiribacter sp. SM1 TaxID=2861196 RepID=UPI001CD210B6|nr:gliding motility-associated C-terminal domain-containing protein [Cesiribacter sp. SM1]
MKALIFLIIFFGVVSIANSQSGTLDKSFGTNEGYTPTPFPNGYSNFYGLAIQSDEKIVAVGEKCMGGKCDNNTSSFDFAIARYEKNGKLDTSFGPNKDGKVVTDFDGRKDNARSVAIQSDGKIVVVGYSSDGSSFDFAIARYEKNGTLDRTFGPNKDGKVITDISSGEDKAFFLLILEDDRILVVGQAKDGKRPSDFAVVCYEKNGMLDTTFGPNKDGKVRTDIKGNADIGRTALIYNQKILVVGEAAVNGSSNDFAIVCYDMNGTLETSFGPNKDGKVVTDFRGGSDRVSTAAIIEEDKKFVVMGDAQIGNSFDFAIARYDMNGTLDTTFGPNKDGKVVTDFRGKDDWGNALAFQTDGSMILAGQAHKGVDFDFALSRYTRNGFIDTSFGPDKNGKVVTAIGAEGENITAALVKDNNLYVAGTYLHPSNPTAVVAAFHLLEDPAIELSVTAGPEAAEPSRHSHFVISSPEPPTEDLLIRYTLWGSAGGGTGKDYTTLPSQQEVKLPAGQKSVKVEIKVEDDLEYERDEQVTLLLNPPTVPGVLLDESQKSATVKIKDNDEEPVPQPELKTSGNCLPGVTLTIENAENATQIVWFKDGKAISTVVPVPATSGSTVAGGGQSGIGPNQLLNPNKVFVDGQNTVYVGDRDNHRIQRWTSGAKSGSTVAGGNGAGAEAKHLYFPNGLHVDGNGNVLIADQDNNRIQMWTPGATSGITIAGTGKQGNDVNEFDSPRGLFIDNEGNLYIADHNNHRIQKWAPGASSGITVAGSGVAGSGAKDLHNPSGVAVDIHNNIYVADRDNHRIQMWTPGADAGITVAGGSKAESEAEKLSSPAGVFVDGVGNLYIADRGNNRIQMWAPGADAGITVAGSGEAGNGADEFDGVWDVFVDKTGNIYAADYKNHRIQKWAAPTLTTTFTPAEPGVYSAAVTYGSKTVNTKAETIREVVEVSVSISAEPSTPIIAGTKVTFTAVPTHGGENPVFVWRVNGVAVKGENGPVFTSSTLKDGDVVMCDLTSDAPCTEEPTISSNSIPITVLPVIELSVTAGPDASEDDEHSYFTITASAKHTEDLMISYNFTGSSALRGSEKDYITDPVGDEVKLAAGETSVQVKILVEGDNVAEDDEEVILTLEPPTAAGVKLDEAKKTASLTIKDDDEDPEPVIELSVTAGPDASEDDEHSYFTITASAKHTEDLMIGYSLSGVALRGSEKDFLTDPAGDEVRLKAGETSVQVKILVEGDDIEEPDEEVILTLEPPTAAGVKLDEAKKTASLTIKDDDEDPVDPDPVLLSVTAGPDASEDDEHSYFTITASAKHTEDLMIGYSLSGVALRGSEKDFLTDPAGDEVRLKAGETSVQVKILVEGDNVAEDDEEVILTLEPPTAAGVKLDEAKKTASLTIKDDDFSGPVIAMLPNLFSPNGDQVNDFFILHATNLQAVHLQIFNRQGRLIFETKSLNAATELGWDGTHNGEDVPEDTYVWILNYQDMAPKPTSLKLKGSVTLIR